MSEGICLYTNLFTLADRDPKKNQYVLMFLMWITSVKRYASLTKNDILYVMIDTRTLDSFKSNTFMGEAVHNIGCPIHFITFAPPTTLLEGCMHKYSFMQPFTQANLIYLDIDILVRRPLRELVAKTQPDRLYVHFEGKLSDDNYGAHLTALGQPPPDELPGASAGKFVITSTQVRDLLFTIIQAENLKQKTSYYTLEQPIYNACFHVLASQKRISIDPSLFPPPILSVNLHNYSDEKTVLLDFMGEPGDGSLHLEKMIGAMCILD